jgi:hypothetical protein
MTGSSSLLEVVTSFQYSTLLHFVVLKAKLLAIAVIREVTH